MPITLEKRGPRWYLLGMSAAGQRKLASEDKWHWDQDGVWRGGLRESDAKEWVAIAEKIDADAKVAEAHNNEQREAERAEYESVEPHWPTYRNVIAWASQARDSADAARHGDVKDINARPGERIAELAASVGVNPSSDFGRLVTSVASGRASEAQAKACAVGLAKRVIVTDSPVELTKAAASIAEERGVAHDQGEPVNMRPAIDRPAITVGVRMASTKKAGVKPYLAVCGDGLKFSFIDGYKVSNTVKEFEAKLQPGSIISFRGALWRGGDYQADSAYGLVLPCGVYQIDRDTALAYDRQRQAGWVAVALAENSTGASVVIQQGPTEAEYVLTRPGVLIAPTAEPEDNEETDEAESPVLVAFVAPETIS